MATIDKKLIHFNRLADFEARLSAGDIRDYSIVCIKDAKLIWTHGEYYGDLSECLKVTQQTLTDEEKRQVQENLGIEIPTATSQLENDSSFVSAVDTTGDPMVGTRSVKDAEIYGTKVYFASHAGATFMSNGQDVESVVVAEQERLDNVEQEMSFGNGHATASSLENIPTNKRLVVASINQSQSLSFEGLVADGKQVHLIVNNSGTSTISVALPNTGNYVCLTDTALSIDAGGHVEVNVISDGNFMYIRGV